VVCPEICRLSMIVLSHKLLSEIINILLNKNNSSLIVNRYNYLIPKLNCVLLWYLGSGNPVSQSNDFFVSLSSLREVQNVKPLMVQEFSSIWNPKAQQLRQEPVILPILNQFSPSCLHSVYHQYLESTVKLALTSWSSAYCLQSVFVHFVWLLQ